MDVENFKRLFLPLHPKLFRIAYALVENKADAEDILQDAYYKLWSRRNELTDIQNPEAFCVTLVKNLCLDFLRSPRANRRDTDVTEAVTLSTASSPDEELERQDKVQQIRHLIDRLPENQRQVLRLRGIEDCSMDEIEQITGLSAVNIRVLLSRARKIIREQLEKYYTYEYGPIIPHAELIVPEDSIIQKFRGMYPEKPYKGTEPGSPAFRKGGYCSQFHPHATFAAMVYRLDVYVGQIIQKLKDKGLYDNTIIIFASDNGPHMEGGADPDFFNSNGIYRGYKRDLYEGGIRVPMIISWPGHVQPNTETDFMCSFWDVLPTFEEIIHPKAKQKEMDGVSMLPLLENRKGQKEHEFLYFEFQELNGRQAVRKGPWKLVHMNIRGDKPYYELYNLASDPSERHNILDQYPEKVAELKDIMVREHRPDPNWPLLKEEKAK